MGLVMLSLKKTRRGTQVSLPSRACLFRALVKSGTIGGCESVKLLSFGSFPKMMERTIAASVDSVMDLVIGPTVS